MKVTFGKPLWPRINISFEFERFPNIPDGHSTAQESFACVHNYWIYVPKILLAMKLYKPIQENLRVKTFFYVLYSKNFAEQ